MSFAVGLLQGVGDAKNLSEARKQRNRELDLMEAMAARPAGAPASGGAPVAGAGAPIGDRPGYAFRYLTERGVPEAAAAGIVGNIMQESGEGINTAAVGDNGNAYGSVQWNGPRKAAYEAFAGERKRALDDFDTQLDFLMHEGQTTEKAAWQAMMGAKTAEEAALIGSKRFWRPGDPRDENRVAYANRVYGATRPGAAAAPTQTSSAPSAETPKRWGFFNRFMEG